MRSIALIDHFLVDAVDPFVPTLITGYPTGCYTDGVAVRRLLDLIDGTGLKRVIFR